MESAASSTVTVTGTGSASAVPDEAVVRLGAVSAAPLVGDAFASVTSTVAAIGEIARRHTESRRIASQNLSVWPKHDEQGRPIGWECRHSLVVRLDDLAAAGALVTGLAEEVGERMVLDGVSLEIADRSTVLAHARDAAFADALARAEQYAGLAHRGLGAVLTVVEGGGGEGPMPRDRAMFAQSASFEPGEQTVSTSVTVTWALGEG